MAAPPPHSRPRVPLAPLTTIGLGGPARFAVHCSSVDDIRSSLLFARESRLNVRVLGGGSNVLFADEGYDGVILRIGLRGVDRSFENGESLIVAAAGEPWDEFVRGCVAKSLQGVECLSGIPGQVGATPIQNVGAYGQEVADTIVRVRGLDRRTLEEIEFPASQCGFGYRQSRFKGSDAGRYIITEVTFRLRPGAMPAIGYPELERHFDAGPAPGEGRSLGAVRDAVLALRRKKSMVIDPNDPHSRSVGSFFMNPVLRSEDFQKLVERERGEIPAFPAAEGVKISAAWLIERAGFRRGFRRGGVGISPRHALALVNYGGTTAELLELANDIREAVDARFSIRLAVEPEIVPFSDG